jgi:hypothetical protein
MRTGSFHQPISLLSICDARLPIPAQLNPSSGSMEMRASTLLVKSPDLTVPNRAKLSGQQDKRFDRDGILISARAEVGQH